MTLNVLVMENKLKVKSTVYPTNSMEYHQWADEFKFGSAHDLCNSKLRQHPLNDHYDFTKLYPKTEKIGFFNLFGLLKFIDL